MGMDRITKRLSEGAPPLRISELSELTGYDPRTLRKLFEAGVVRTVGLTNERRVPVTEARRLARELGLLTE
jgi:hypothetical protein